MSNCGCTDIDNVTCCPQTLSIDGSTGDLTISDGNTVNLCASVKTCETQTILQSVALIGTILQVTYVGENGVPQSRSANLVGLSGGGGGTAIAVQNTQSINLSLLSDVLTANFILDPASTAPVSVGPNGVRIDCCNVRPTITANTTNTITMTVTGGNSLSSDLKYIDSGSINFSDSVAGLTGVVKYSTDANNIATAGTDGGIYVAATSLCYSTDANNSAINGSDGCLYVPDTCSTLATFTPAGNAIPGVTQLVGADCQLYTFIGSSTTADNGLTLTGSNIQLGGTLLHDTIVDGTALYQMVFTSALTGNVATLNGFNTASGSGVLGTALGGNGVAGAATSGVGVTGRATSGVGGQFASTTGTAIFGSITPATTNTVDNVISLYRDTTGTAAAGIGQSINFFNKTTIGLWTSNQIISKWTSAVEANRTSQFEVWGTNLAVTSQQLTLKGTGQLQLNKYGVGTFTGTAAFNLGIDSSGNVIEISPGGGLSANNGLNISSGTNVQLGGPLVKNTFLTTSAFYLDLQSSNGSQTLNIGNSSSGVGIVSITSSGDAYQGFSTSGSGMSATSTSGVGLAAASNTNLAGVFSVTPATTNAAVGVITISAGTSGTPANGLGGYLNFTVQTVGGGGTTSNKLISTWTDVTFATRTSKFEIQGLSSGTLISQFVIKGNGTISIPQIQNFASNALALAGGLVANDVYRNGDVLSIVH